MNVLKVRDPFSKYKIKHKMFDIPFSLIIVGKSELSGKTNFITNLLLNKQFGYEGVWNGEDIYIISASIHNDHKIKVIKRNLEIPSANMMEIYDNMLLTEIYGMIKDNYELAVQENMKPVQSLMIFDDISYGRTLKKKGSIIEKIFSNGRHLLISVITTCQSYTSLLTECRENSKGVILFDMSSRQLELVMDDHNSVDRKQFKKAYRDCASKEPYSFMVVNYSNHPNERFLNKHFEPINFENY
tara:strand:+ start:1042 stop:1770 length:729 start_codon:yes stop_codon:yes gene_type:complete